MSKRTLQIAMGESALSLSAVIDACKQAEETALQIFNKAKEANEIKTKRRKEEIEEVYEAATKEAIALQVEELGRIKERRDQLDAQKSACEIAQKERYELLQEEKSTLTKLENSLSAAEKLGLTSESFTRAKEEVAAKLLETEYSLAKMLQNWKAETDKFQVTANEGNEQLAKEETAALQRSTEAIAEPRRIWQEATQAIDEEYQATFRAAYMEYQETLTGIEAKRKQALTAFASGESN
jgi:hypothetical protein